MKNHTRFTAIFIAPLILFFVASCVKSYDKRGVYKGQQTAIADGYFQPFVKVDNLGVPKEIGFTMNSAGLEHLPDTGHGNHHEYEAALPKEAFRTPFTHVVINWNPSGHEPPGIYDKAHFDFHFYTVSSTERKTIPDYNSAPSKFQNQPDKSYFPPHYVMAPGGEPRMGAHWVDTTYKEFTGQGFSETFVYGSYDGKVNFIEPMITYEFMKGLTNFSRSIPQPAKVNKSGYYPRHMRIVKEGDEYTFYLEHFIYREAQ